MRITYGPRQNVAYIRPKEEPAEVETLRISDEMNTGLRVRGGVLRGVVAGREGFEPPLTGPEPVGLPLADLPEALAF